MQNHDLIAAEAHYHVTCYKLFTRVRPGKPMSIEKDEQEDEYCIKEALSLEKLFHYIRNEVIAKEQVTTLVDLTSKLVQFLREAGLQQILDSTKKHLKRKLVSEFRSAISMFPNERGRIIFLPVNVSASKLASEIVELKQELKQYRIESEKSSKIAKYAALLLRSEAKSFQSPLAWPPLVSQLQSNDFPLPRHLNMFVTTLLGINEEKVCTPRTASLGQDILYMVSKGKCMTPKHVLLPFTVKSLTGNVEVVRILNRLGHRVSYSKTLEIDTAFALLKLATQSMRGFVLPENIYPHVQVSLVYDNIDRLEEMLSGADTSHRVNGIVIQEKVIGPEPDGLRYAMFCAKKGELESHQLPPCRHCLYKHILRANYQAFVWKSCLVACPIIPSPVGYVWKHEGEMKETMTKIQTLRIHECHEFILLYLILESIT